MTQEERRDFFTPTIIFFAPEIPADSLFFIQQNIKLRLGARCEALVQFEQFSPQMDKSQIMETLRRVTSQDYWAGLTHQNLISDNFLLDDKISPDVNFLFITNHPDEGIAKTHSDFLASFMKAYGKKLEETIHPLFVLICVGKFRAHEQICGQFWPRIHLSETNQVKLRVQDWKYYQETIANLIMGFIATDLITSLPPDVKKQNPEWLVFGASSVIVDLEMMKQYMLHRLSRILTDKLISDPPSSQEQYHIKQAIQKHLGGESEKLVEINQGLLRENFDTERKSSAFSRIEINKKSPLRTVIDEPAESIESLSKIYKIDNVNTKKVLEQDAIRQYDRHIQFIGHMIDKQYTKEMFSGVVSFDEQQKYQIGLRTALFALQHWNDNTNKMPGRIIRERTVVKPLQISGEKAIKLITFADIRFLKERKSVLDHFQKKLGNVVGTLLIITPLVPILAEFLRRRYISSVLVAFLVAIVGVGLVGAIPYLYFRGVLHQRKQEYLFAAESKLTESCLRFLAFHNRNIQKIILKRIQNIRTNLENIVTGIDRLRAYIKGELIHVSKNKDQDINKETVSIYEMADYDTCDDWIDQAEKYIQSERAKGNDFTREFLTTQLLPNIFTTGSALPVYTLVFSKANELIEKYFYPDSLHTYQLAFKMSDLSEGKLWKWLQMSAIPLGVRDDDEAVTTIFSIRDSVEDRAALSGAYGESNSLYPKDSLLIDASLSFEINCFRFFLHK
jgi:hypothetical protein